MGATRSWFGCFFVGCLCLTLTACGGGKVKGKLTHNGKPIEVSEKGVIQMSLVPAEGGSPLPVTLDTKTGDFTVPGIEGKGVPSGKYKVAVSVIDPYPKGTDLFEGKYNMARTDVVVDVKGSTELNIDLK